MHPDNSYYGHRTILQEAAQGHRPIRAHVQHGWAVGTGLPAPARLVPRLPLLVWSERNLQACRSEGLTGVHAIGAPFLYLCETSAPTTTPSRGTIVYPHHGWRREGVRGSHEDYVSAIAAREGREGTTVCLYWREMEDQATRAHYEGAGFRVICHGRMDDPEFLTRLRSEMNDHRRVVTNRVGTALWYGAALGKEVSVYGPFFASQETDAEASAFADFQRAEWPELFGTGISSDHAQALGRQELGWDHLRSPEELASLFGWARPERTDFIAEASVRSRHALRQVVARQLERFAP